MEKAISVEERIKRAEDIYYKRNGQCPKVERKKTKTKSTKKRTIVRKMLMQIFICLMIYVCFYAITNSEYVFSEEFRTEVKAKFSKENFDQICTNVKIFFDKNILRKETDEDIGTNGGTESTENTEEKTGEDGGTNENTEGTEDTNGAESKEENTGESTGESTGENTGESTGANAEGVGGATDSESSDDKSNETNTAETTELDEAAQMKKDAEDIKAKISFIVPVNGTISSTFGWRNPTTSTVPRYHTGLDIATTEGTVIKSATEGTVILVSSEGDYGNHYKIQIEDVTIIYAHCKKLYLKEGDKVTQGQEIGEVGSTGNSTRSTPTF